MTSVLTSNTFELVRKHCKICNPPRRLTKTEKSRRRTVKNKEKWRLLRERCGVCN